MQRGLEERLRAEVAKFDQLVAVAGTPIEVVERQRLVVGDASGELRRAEAAVETAEADVAEELSGFGAEAERGLP